MCAYTYAASKMTPIILRVTSLLCESYMYYTYIIRMYNNIMLLIPMSTCSVNTTNGVRATKIVTLSRVR